MTLRENVESLRADLIGYMDKGYIPGPEFLPRVRDFLDQALTADTVENIDRCILNDWCRAPLGHEGACQPFADAEQIFDFFSNDGQVKVEITKALGKPARCEVRHRGVLLFAGEQDVARIPIPEPQIKPQPLAEVFAQNPEFGDTPGEEV